MNASQANLNKNHARLFQLMSEAPGQALKPFAFIDALHAAGLDPNDDRVMDFAFHELQIVQTVYPPMFRMTRPSLKAKDSIGG